MNYPLATCRVNKISYKLPESYEESIGITFFIKNRPVVFETINSRVVIFKTQCFKHEFETFVLNILFIV